MFIKKSVCLLFIGGSKASWIKRVAFEKGKATVQYEIKQMNQFNPNKYVLTYGKNGRVTSE